MDFVVYGPDTFFAIEVKNARELRSKDFRGLVEFLKDYPEARALMLHRGKDRLKVKGIPCIPCETFLKALHPTASMVKVLDEAWGY